LVLPDVPRAQAIRRTLEISRGGFDGADVIVGGSPGVMTTLEFLQHEFA
jgi:hypothetical protein